LPSTGAVGEPAPKTSKAKTPEEAGTVSSMKEQITRAAFYIGTGLVILLALLATVPIIVLTWSAYWYEKRKEREQ
jgi:hypothetical protein